jgi:putative addiction module CopG family antidote
MAIHLSKDLEQFVHDAVRAGRYASDDDVIRDALNRLKQAMSTDAANPPRNARRAEAASQTMQPLSPDELNRRLLAAGLVTQLPDPAEDIDDDDDPPIMIQGEPLSETIIRERR